MAGRLADAVAAALGASGKTLERGALLNEDGLDLQFVDVSAVVVLSVGDSGLQNLLDDHSSFFLREFENVQSLVNLLAANQIRNQTAFVNRQANAAEDCTFQTWSTPYRFAFLSAG